MDELSSVENKNNLLYIDRGLSSLMSAKNVSGGNSSSSESACSINFLPLLPKSSSGHSSASTESSSSSSTSSAAAVAVVMSAAMNNSSSSSSSSPSPPKSPLKHNNHHNHQSQMNSPFILNAFVNGFVQLKLCADKIDYAYIIEIYWSNESRSFVKRTFDDFVEFHARFLTEFADFFSSSTSSADSRTSPLHHISPTVQRKKPPPPPLNDSKSKFFNFAAKPMFELIPVLPVAKKRFWMSQLKLAESREIELNNYVQHLLKLPTNISHSGVVIKFFESQSSDPKPAGSYFHKSEVNDYEEERDDFDDDEDEVNSSSLNNSNYADDELTRCQQRISSISNHNSSSSSDEDENDDENDDEDDDDDDDDRPHINLPHSAILSSDYSGRLSALSSSHYSTGGGLRNLRKKSSNKQSSLWWDEDNALNELTTSISTEFGSQFNLNNNNSNNQKFGYKIECDEATTTTCKLEDDEEEEDIQTLKTLDNMIKTSELFNDETPSSN